MIGLMSSPEGLVLEMLFIECRAGASPVKSLITYYTGLCFALSPLVTPQY